MLPEQDPSGPWAELIGETSTDDGVEYAAIAARRSALDWYLGWIAVHGPATDAMKDNWEDMRIAFLLNAYNALLIAGMLDRGAAAGLDRHFLEDTAFRVDGDWITPRRFAEERLIARFQEPLLYLALFQATRGGPTLRWWKQDPLQTELAAAAAAFLASDRGMRREGEGWAASALIMDHTADYLEWGEADTLCAWMARYTQGERQAWLLLNKDACPLGVFPVDESPDVRLPHAAEDAERR